MNESATRGVKGRLALLVVDVQEAAVGPGLYEGEAVLGNIASLIAACRESVVDVVFVQDEGPPGSAYERGSAGWRIHRAVRPRPDEHVVRKSANSAFRRTDLQAHLDRRGIRTLVMVGLHTEFCFDTTLRVAFELGYHLIVPELTNSTFGRGGLTAEAIYRHHNEEIFRDRFATYVSMPEALRIIERTTPGDGVSPGTPGEAVR